MKKTRFWLNSKDILRKRERALNDIKKLKKKLKKPINEKTGKLLKPETIRKYKARCKKLENYVQYSKDVCSKMLQAGNGCSYPLSTFKDVDSYEDLIKELPKVKASIKQDKRFQTDELIKMAQFVLFHLDQDKTFGIFLCGSILSVFRGLLDHMTGVNTEDIATTLLRSLLNCLSPAQEI